MPGPSCYGITFAGDVFLKLGREVHLNIIQVGWPATDGLSATGCNSVLPGFYLVKCVVAKLGFHLFREQPMARHMIHLDGGEMNSRLRSNVRMPMHC